MYKKKSRLASPTNTQSDNHKVIEALRYKLRRIPVEILCIPPTTGNQTYPICTRSDVARSNAINAQNDTVMRAIRAPLHCHSYHHQDVDSL